ncbi:MAG: hypothetical protein J6K23_00690 [Bacilli bacterium]|nr:hypothetical protein [Bacilli bacterium]MCI6932410.1 hypothetical protein [Mycoplasmatota bacterium]
MKKYIILTIIMFLIVTKSLMTDYQTKMLINQNLSTYYLKYQNIDSSYIEIKHTQSENKVFISIYRLTTFTGTIIKKKNNIIYIKALDPNNHNIYFKFNLDTKVLTVTKSSWLYLNKGDTFSFNL